jgi:hypothetical protein
MARGWESKSVDDQIVAAQSTAAERRQAAGAPVDRERETRITGLRLARAKAQQDLQLACDRRHRALLERTLEHLEAELSALSSPSARSSKETP